MVFVWVMTSRSKHFSKGVRATEWQTLRQVIDDFFCIGIMVAVLKHVGTTDCANKLLKMSVRTTVSWVKHPFSMRQGMRFGSLALTLYRVPFTSAVGTESIWSSGGCSPGVPGSSGYTVCDLGLFYPSSMVVLGFPQCFTFNIVTCPESSISCFEEGANLCIKPRLLF